MNTRYFIFFTLFFIFCVTAQTITNADSYNHFLNENYYTLKMAYNDNFTRFYDNYLKTYDSKMNLLKNLFLIELILMVYFAYILVLLEVEEWKEEKEIQKRLIGN